MNNFNKDFNNDSNKHNNNSFVKMIALGLVFGMVAGSTFTGVSYVGSKVTSKDSESSESAQAESSKTSSALSTSTNTSLLSASKETSEDVSTVVSNLMPSVVAITCVSQEEYSSFFGPAQTYDTESSGSGIIIAKDDDNFYIATNNHVVSGANSLTIEFSDGTTAAGQIKGTSSAYDLAVVTVAKSDLSDDTLNTIKVASLGDSDSLQVGETAIAIGNALGYGQSVTTGVISALNRSVTTSDETTGQSITNYLIQTDAAINPGNSGGALINMDGQVIGINSAKYTDESVEGMGYAIPITTAKSILEKIMTKDKADESKAGYLGIQAADVTSETSENYNMPTGVYVSSVTSGLADEEAGIQTGDIITSFGGESISTLAQLQDALAYYEAGTKVQVTVMRTEDKDGDYTEKTFTVTLSSKQSSSDSSQNSSQYSQSENSDEDLYNYFFGSDGSDSQYGYSYSDPSQENQYPGQENQYPGQEGQGSGSSLF